MTFNPGDLDGSRPRSRSAWVRQPVIAHHLWIRTWRRRPDRHPAGGSRRRPNPGCPASSPDPRRGTGHWPADSAGRTGNPTTVPEPPCGGVPGIVGSRCGSSPSIRGIESSSALVYGCARRIDDAFGGTDSTMTPAYMMTMPIAEVRHHAEIVADQHHGAAVVVGQRVEHVQHLGLDGHVERGRRLVRDDQSRGAADGDRDADPLAHAAGERVRIVFEAPVGIGDSNALQQFRGRGLRRRFGQPRWRRSVSVI